MGKKTPPVKLLPAVEGTEEKAIEKTERQLQLVNTRLSLSTVEADRALNESEHISGRYLFAVLWLRETQVTFL